MTDRFAPARRRLAVARDATSAAWWRTSARVERRPGIGGQVLFVVGQPRTGTNLACDLLNQVSGVTLAGELLNPDEPGHPAPRTSRDARRLLDAGLAALPGPVVGAKILLGQLLPWRFTLEELDDRYPGARFLVLRRRSLLDQYVSLQVALATGRWTQATHDPADVAMKAGPPTVEVSAPRLRSWCDGQAEHYERAARELPAGRTAWVDYEDLAADGAAHLHAALGPLLAATLPPAAWDAVGPPRLRRQRTLPLSEIVVDLARSVPDPAASWLWLPEREGRASGPAPGPGPQETR